MAGTSNGRRSTMVVVVLVLVVMMVVLVAVCDAQDSNDNRNNRNRNSNSNSNNSNNNGSSRSRQRGSATATNRRRGGNRRRQPHPSCEEIYLPMCKGLVPYTHTKLPNKFNHTTQMEVYRVLEHMWSHVDHSCSSNLRHFVCSLYLPKCHGRRAVGLGPCKRTCMAAKRRCSRPLREMMGVTWANTYPCAGLPNRRCLRPVRERACPHQHPTCVENHVLPVCANLTFTWGTVPNMFQQCHAQEMNTEIAYYDRLVATRCHDNINFLLCGVYSPFCVRGEVPFTFPCRELCEEIRAACEGHYRRLYHDLPWPNKLQCHRYPSTETDGYNCVMPNEGGIHMGGR